MFAKTPGFDNIMDAIEYGKKTHTQRHAELGLDITPIRNRKVVQFHWDFEQLALQFDNDLFLRVYLDCNKDDRIYVSVVKDICIQTDRFLAFDLLMSETHSFLWKPFQIAKKYTEKVFKGVSLGERHLNLYFPEMPLLLFCCVEQDITNDRLMLFWSEGERVCPQGSESELS